MKHPNSIQDNIRNAVSQIDDGKVFSIHLFDNITDSDNIRSSLSRIAQESKITMLAKGYYVKGKKKSISKNEISQIVNLHCQKYSYEVIPTLETAKMFLFNDKIPSTTLSFISNGKVNHRITLTNGKKIEINATTTNKFFKVKDSDIRTIFRLLYDDPDSIILYYDYWEKCCKIIGRKKREYLERQIKDLPSKYRKIFNSMS